MNGEHAEVDEEYLKCQRSGHACCDGQELTDHVLFGMSTSTKVVNSSCLHKSRFAARWKFALQLCARE